MLTRIVVSAAGPHETYPKGREVPKILYTNSEGAEHAIDGNIGDSVMETAVRNGVKGIVAECGGACICATCHVYVREEFLGLLVDMDEQEDDMLDGAAAERRANSRLSCQLEITEELDGLHVDLPSEQL